MIPEPDCGDFVPMDETLKEKIALFRYPDGYAGETVDVLYDPYDPARPVHFRALASRRPAPPPRAGQRRPLRVYAYVHALVRRTVRSLHAGQRLHLVRASGDPARLRLRPRSRYAAWCARCWR